MICKYGPMNNDLNICVSKNLASSRFGKADSTDRWMGENNGWDNRILKRCFVATPTKQPSAEPGASSDANWC